MHVGDEASFANVVAAMTATDDIPFGATACCLVST